MAESLNCDNYNTSDFQYHTLSLQLTMTPQFTLGKNNLITLQLYHICSMLSVWSINTVWFVFVFSLLGLAPLT